MVAQLTNGVLTSPTSSTTSTGPDLTIPNRIVELQNKYNGGTALTPAEQSELTGLYGSAGTPTPNQIGFTTPPSGTTGGGTPLYTQTQVNDFNTARGNTNGSITDSINAAGGNFQGSILDFLDTYGAGQRNIDKQSTQNELSKAQGRQSILDMVGRGLQSGGVLLNNSGAATSSAADAIKRAYGDYGRRQLSTVGNQYELGKDNINGEQEDLTRSVETFRRKLGEGKTDTVNNIVASATTQLAALNAQAASASLPDRINIEAEKTRIRDEALTKLATFDGLLDSGVSATQPKSADANRGEAYRLLNLGTAPENSFDFATSAPASVGSLGGTTSNLPLYTGTTKKKTE